MDSWHLNESEFGIPFDVLSHRPWERIINRNEGELVSSVVKSPLIDPCLNLFRVCRIEPVRASTFGGTGHLSHQGIVAAQVRKVPALVHKQIVPGRVSPPHKVESKLHEHSGRANDLPRTVLH